MRKLKLIWDFRGPDAKKIAEHHIVHLNEYLAIKKIADAFTGLQTVSDLHSIAFMVVDEDKMPPIRDALKPHRGQLYIKP